MRLFSLAMVILYYRIGKKYSKVLFIIIIYLFMSILKYKTLKCSNGACFTASGILDFALSVFRFGLSEKRCENKLIVYDY